MAKKKEERKTSSFSELTGWAKILRSETTDFLIGVIVILFAAFLTVAMVSFINTGADDQSILSNLRPTDWMNKGRAFSNCCGSTGAILSYLFMTENFGYAAFIIPVFLLVTGVKMTRFYTVNLKKWFFGTAMTMIWLSATLSKILTPLMPDSFFNPGGDNGAIEVEFIENVAGAPGLTAILVFTAIAILTFISRQTITWIRHIMNPLKTIPNRVGNIVQDTMTNIKEGNTANGNTDDDTDADNDKTAQAATAPKAQPVPMPNSSKDSAEQPAVIDLTNFAELGAAKPKKADTSAPKASNAADRNAQIANMPGSTYTAPKADGASGKFTVEVGREEKATGNATTHYDINTPINPLEPFTKYKFPSLSLLKKDDNEGRPYVDMDEIKAHNEEIVNVLKSFGIEIREIKATVGPTITLYEITPAEGIRITKIRNLEDDIALRLSALGVRIIAPIPGKGTIGIEVPNKKRHNVSMESILNSKKFQDTKFELPIALGKTITNEVFMADLTKIPHLLVAGATGQGKSVGLNVIITSLLYKKHPNELKLVLIDPKKVEFSVYAPIADHFMAQVDDDDEPIITDVTKVVRTLKSLCTLMDHRYDMLKLAGSRNIKEYNAKFLNHKLNPEDGHEFMPYIVVIIDEFGDLIMTAGKEVEMPIARIAQLARAVGIHMIIATQRPTTSIITGNIKANFPGRIAFKVSSMMDSRIILDRPGANQLIGMGDMLYLNGNEPTRVQCAFIDTGEIGAINQYIMNQPGPIQPMELPEPKSDDSADSTAAKGGDMSNIDPFFEEAARSVVTTQQGSTSMIQRRFSIGYNRAGRLMDQLESAGIVGAAHGGKPREVLVADEMQLNAILNMLKQK